MVSKKLKGTLEKLVTTMKIILSTRLMIREQELPTQNIKYLN